MAGAVVNSDTCIGKNVIINTRASVDHDCSVGDGTFVCAGATVIPNRTIGRDVIVGAGSTVIWNIWNVPAGATVVGIPAKIVRQL